MTLRWPSTVLFSVSLMLAPAVLGGPLPGSQVRPAHVPRSVKYDGVTIPLQKHVLRPNVTQRTPHSLPGAYWTFATQLGGQPVELALDSGMSAAVLLTDAAGWTAYDGQRYYDPSQSPSYRDAGRLTCGWKMPSLPYHDMRDVLELVNGNATVDVKGSWATEELRFGDGPYVASVTPFILARLSDDVNRQFMAGGALGLALGIDVSKSAVQRILTGFDMKAVTLWFENGASSLEKTSGAITFDGKDELHCDTYWVEASGDWMVRLNDVAVGPTPLVSNARNEAAVGARVSVSTPFLELPYDEYVELVATLRYFANVTDSETPGIIVVNCAEVAGLPAIGVHMGDVSVVVTGEEYTAESKEDPNTCVILIKLANPGPWTLGLPFLPKGCVSYDYENAVLGFAKPANR